VSEEYIQQYIHYSERRVTEYIQQYIQERITVPEAALRCNALLPEQYALHCV
jgi:hypothetical protein